MMISPHRGRAPLLLVAGRTLCPDHLPDAVQPQPLDDPRAHHEGEDQGGDRRAGGPEGDVIEEIEQDVLLAERRQPMIEHGDPVPSS
jgi:hypothetical protein